MATEFELNTPAAEALQGAVQSKLVELEWVTGQEDMALAEYIMLSVASGKPQAEISSELANEFLGLEPNDANVVGFVGWLVQQAESAASGAANGTQQTADQPMDSNTVGTSNEDADMDDSANVAQDGSIPTGPKSMRNGGKTRGNPMLSHVNKAMDRRGGDSALHRVRGGAGVGKNGAPRGPSGKGSRGGGRGMNAHQMQQIGNMAMGGGNGQLDPSMGNMMNMNPQNMDPGQMMAMMQMFMNQQQQMTGNYGNQMQGGKSLFDRVSGRGRGRGRGGRGGSFSDRGQQGENATDAMELTSDADGASQNNSTDPWNTLCRYNQRCGNPDCTFAHVSPAAPHYTNVDLEVDCSFGIKCKNHKCVGKHPSPASAQKEVCRFYPNCTNPTCPYEHPKGAAPCRNGADCKVEGCTFFHNQTPCRFNPCTNPACPYKHEEGQKSTGTTSKAGNKVWVNPSIEAEENKTHVSERKFAAEEGGQEELIIPSKANGDQQQDQQQQPGEMIA